MSSLMRRSISSLDEKHINSTRGLLLLTVPQLVWALPGRGITVYAGSEDCGQGGQEKKGAGVYVDVECCVLDLGCFGAD